MVALQIVWNLVLRSYVPVLIHDALPVTDYQSLHHFVRSCVSVGFFISSFSGTLTSSSILGSLDIKYLDKLNSYLGPVLQSPGNSSLLDAGTLRQAVGRHQHSTATVMERVPLSPSSKSVTTYLVDTSTSRGEVSI